MTRVSRSTGTKTSGDHRPRRLKRWLPYLVGMLTEIAHDDTESRLGWCDDQAEFEFGLDLLPNGIEQLNGRQ